MSDWFLTLPIWVQQALITVWIIGLTSPFWGGLLMLLHGAWVQRKK